MECTNCRKKIPVVPVYVKLSTGKLVGPYCERCAERVASGQAKASSAKEAA